MSDIWRNIVQYIKHILDWVKFMAPALQFLGPVIDRKTSNEAVDAEKTLLNGSQLIFPFEQQLCYRFFLFATCLNSHRD